MIGTIIVYALLLCGLILIIAMLYMRPSQVQLSDKAVDLSKVMPIQTITDGVIVNGNGDLTIGYRLFLPEYSLFLKKRLKVFKIVLMGF